MARTGFFHHIGTLLLLAAAILLIVTCVSAPVVKDLAILKVDLGNGRGSGGGSGKATFGTFGYCLKNVGGSGWACSGDHVGYSPAAVMSRVDNTDFSGHMRSATRALTKAMILHPIACGINFIAFLLALGAGVIGSFVASLVALFAFIITVVIMIIDFVLFTIVRDKVNGKDTGAHAHYDAAAWTLLASAICSLLGTIIVFFTCCSARIHRGRTASGAKA